MGSNGTREPISFTFGALQKITKNFSEERALGQGAYGKVYRGVHEDGREIAVKLLHNNIQAIDDEPFQQFEGRLVFSERTYKALCFEYMPKGSLQKHLSEECDGLDWHTRYKIIKGTSEGLKYLHEGSEEPFYHLDLKPDNILLDENMEPKLADFGLSRLIGEEQTRVTQSTLGTIGYLPPEYIHGNIVTKKFDIFSLGVVMTKIIAGRRGNSRSAEMPYQEFLDQVQGNWRNRLETTCSSSRLLEAYCQQVNICTDIGVSCMEMDRHKRPSIVDIMHKLDDAETLIDKVWPWSMSWDSSMQGDMVNLKALAKSKAIPGDDTCSEFPVLVRVASPPWRRTEETPRFGLDVVAVLDCRRWNYDTRGGQPWLPSVVIDKLGPDDRLSIVSFTMHFAIMELTFMSDQGRRDVARRVAILSELKGLCWYNNTSAGLQEGAEILRGRGVEERNSRVGCIILVSDSYDRAILREICSEFPTHTFGCHNDHSPEVLKYIADSTSGTYYLVSGEAHQTKDAYELFISGLTKIAATSVEITLRAHEGVAISSIESGGHSNFVSSDRLSGEVRIDNVCAGEHKNFIVYLKVGEGSRKLVTVGGRYRSLNASKQLADLDVSVLRPRSPGKLAAAIHHEVAAELLRIRLWKGIWAIIRKCHRLTKENLDELWDGMMLSEEGHGAQEETLSDFGRDMAEIRKFATLIRCQHPERGALPNVMGE